MYSMRGPPGLEGAAQPVPMVAAMPNIRPSGGFGGSTTPTVVVRTLFPETWVWTDTMTR